MLSAEKVHIQTQKQLVCTAFLTHCPVVHALLLAPPPPPPFPVSRGLHGTDNGIVRVWRHWSGESQDQPRMVTAWKALTDMLRSPKCMYVQVYVCTNVCMCKCMYCVSVLMFKCMYCTNVCMYKCMYVCASVCMCKHRISMVQACVLGCCCTHLQCIERRLLLAISLLVYLVW